MTDEFGAFNPFEEEAEETSTEENSVEKDSSKKEQIQQADNERINEIEEEYKELNEDLLDIDDDSEDTLWMIQRVGVSILKIVGIVGIVGLILWSIWGGGNNDSKIKTKNPAKKIEKIEKEIVKKGESILHSDKKTAQKSVKKSTKKDDEPGFFSKLFGGGKKKTPPAKKEEKVVKTEEVMEKPEKSRRAPQGGGEVSAVVYQDEENEVSSANQKDNSVQNNQNFAGFSTTHPASIQIMAWNYWVEKNRLLGQKNTPGEVALWTKDAESIFDVPFAQQVKGKNDVEREKKVNALVLDTTNLLQRAENLQKKLSAEITDFTRKEQQNIAKATEYEKLFLNAMNNSDPSGIDEYLAKKIEFEKKQTENGIQKESRQYLSEKIDSYAQVLMNLREYLIANRKALIKDVQVVQFPEDPFNRIIPLETWERLGVGGK